MCEKYVCMTGVGNFLKKKKNIVSAGIREV